jgi:hypothetical protein
MTDFNPTPYPDLNGVLRELITRVQGALGANFIGVYLQGSFAVGDFDEHSDVDFIVVTARDLSADEVNTLQVIHPQLYDLPVAWAQHLEGSYFPQEILRRTDPSGSPLWYLDHGSRTLIHDRHCNTVVVRWTVRAYGVTLAGPPPESLIDPIPVETLRREIVTTLNTWGQEILDHAEHYNNRFYQGFIVLSYCRMLHDLHQGHPGSKRAGAEWAKTHLDPQWIGLIDRTWDCRPDPARSVRTRPDPDDFRATLDFVRYIMQQSAPFAD